MKATKLEMVKDIFFAATNGKRTLANFVDGQFLIEMIAKHNYKWAIEDWVNDYCEGKFSAFIILDKMVRRTIANAKGSNFNHTYTSKEIERAYYNNFF